VLGDYDSGITLPVPIDRAPGAKQIEFRYESDPSRAGGTESFPDLLLVDFDY